MAELRVTIDGVERDALVRLFRDLRAAGRLPAELRGLATVLVDAVRLSARRDVEVLQQRVSARKPEVAEIAEAARPWLTSGEAADALGVSGRRVRQLCAASTGPIARGPGNDWRPTPDDLERWRASGVGAHAR